VIGSLPSFGVDAIIVSQVVLSSRETSMRTFPVMLSEVQFTFLAINLGSASPPLKFVIVILDPL
jgi:hypothetical protein